MEAEEVTPSSRVLLQLRKQPCGHIDCRVREHNLLPRRRGTDAIALQRDRHCGRSTGGYGRGGLTGTG